MGVSIKIIVDHKGNILADFDGFEGTDCLEAERELQDKLLKYGVQISERFAVLKHEYGEAGQRLQERGSLWKKI